MSERVNVDRHIVESAIAMIEKAYIPDPRFGSPTLEALKSAIATQQEQPK